MNSFEILKLRVGDPLDQVPFYTKTLGMTKKPDGCLGYSGPDCDLQFIDGAERRPLNGPTDFYWKIGITVANLDHAVAWLDAQGWPVSRPRQFQDIGYLCHLKDPSGLSIELLQHRFEGDEKPAPSGHAIGAQATLAHVTLRVTDLAQAQTVCAAQGLRLMSVQPVPDYGFSLYFYGWSKETLPVPELNAVENRPWLWARPYTILELQHLEHDVGLRSVAYEEAGIVALQFAGKDFPLNQLADVPA